MTKRDAPLTFLGSGFPAGSAVFLKSRFRLYSVSPIPLKLTTDRVAAREVLAAAITAWFDLALQQRVAPTLRLEAAHQRDNGQIDG